MLSTLAARKGPVTALAVGRPFLLARKASALAVRDDKEPQYEFEDQMARHIMPVPPVEEKMMYWKRANEVFFGPERDFKNFPTVELPERIDYETNFVVIPTAWFKELYPRMGVSGCYSLFWLSFLFCLNKEIISPDEALGELILYSSVFFVAGRYFGKQIGDKLDAYADNFLEEQYLGPLKEAQAKNRETLAMANDQVESIKSVPMIYEAKKEQIDLQLESEYRERVAKVYKDVRNRLEYMAEKEAAQRKFEQDLMINWVVSSVEKAITPQQEKQNIASCIAGLKNLAKTATL